MAEFGLTEDGLNIKRLPDLELDLLISEREEVHSDISAEEDDVLGQWNDVLAAAMAEIYELIEAVNDNFNILVAEGKALDDLAALITLKRLAEQVSYTETQVFIGQEGSPVLSDTILESPTTRDRFTVTNSITLESAECLSATYSVNQVLDDTVYTLVVNSTTYTYTSDYSATELEILNGLQSQVAGDNAATWTATVDTDAAQITIETDDDDDKISVSSVTYLSVDEVKTDGRVEAITSGSLIVPANSVTRVISTVPGLTSTTNPDSYILGRDEETDEELRERIQTSQQITGRSTVEAIRDAVDNVTGVTFARVIENDTMEVDGQGRPPKSFEVIAQGGDEDVIALTIWQTKPAGISTFGNTTVIVQDSSDEEKTINFTRPVVINIAVRVTYTLYSEEEFPASGEDSIAEAALAHIQTLDIDEDVIATRFYGPIYTSVSGIDDLLVEIQEIANAGDAPNPASWQEARLAIEFDEIASATLVDISVVGP